jgi:hypothetical protein
MPDGPASLGGCGGAVRMTTGEASEVGEATDLGARISSGLSCALLVIRTGWIAIGSSSFSSSVPSPHEPMKNDDSKTTDTTRFGQGLQPWMAHGRLDNLR